MNPNSVQQEILLVANTSFFKQQLCTNSRQERAVPVIEQLEDACWNGMLYEIFPDIVERSARGRKLFLWQVLQSNGCLEMELGENPKAVEESHSLNPYKFYTALRCN